MKVAVVTGAAGLVGSEAVRFFSAQGFKVIGIDNDMRRYFFGDEATTAGNLSSLEHAGMDFVNHTVDIRDASAVLRIFDTYGKDIALVIHCAGQPSHDWAVREPLTDFGVNATGTLHLLEAARLHCPEAVFIFMSTNKVYGDRVNSLLFRELETRWELDGAHVYFKGVDENMSLDQCRHSLFGASKVAADIMVQEYGRYFGMKTAIFRAGCITGQRHCGVPQHGYLAYLMKCAVTGREYEIFGYKGKQVRDNIHSYDLVNAFYHFYLAPRSAAVYNIGGGRFSHCSMLESIALCEKIAGKPMKVRYNAVNRSGDHIWWVSDTGRFSADYPGWSLTRRVEDILVEMHESNKVFWSGQT
ncbi:MAG: NAD-dependent epimerase/dehydratase family protein [Candidatus Omnitrophica bacterium]|nr:NAD-dependent epimerase/dehydratase family protein [Candidatus Omnitrophota bacterium]